jgi:hypothetical protein
MSLAKFVWSIQNKCLWLSRADLLDDPWEISLSGEQLQLVKDRHPLTPLGDRQRETAEERAKRILGLWRRNTFISCWNSSPNESNALWRIYCKSLDGVVLQTTYRKLKLIKGPHSLYGVTYPIPGSEKRTPTHADLVTKKRPMFAYEEELRIVFYDETKESEAIKGHRLDFDFENLIESIRVHPEADESLLSTVQNLVKTYAPNFSGNVVWSDMALKPPI